MEVGILISPSLAGIVYDRAGYLAVFFMIFGAIGCDLVLRLFMIEKKEANKWRTGTSQYIIEYPYIEDSQSTESDSDYSGSSEESIETDSEIEEQDTPPDETSPLINRNSKETKSWMSHTLAKMSVLVGSRRLMAVIWLLYVYISIVWFRCDPTPICQAYFRMGFCWCRGSVLSAFKSMCPGTYVRCALGSLRLKTVVYHRLCHCHSWFSTACSG